ncbi:hypothetical protein HH_0448 [Helicobacter hepaticus ATCC 51449]|uniref:Uncharacterized protein n=1 Tax=Helicobacter hepaticus (strain ATCC 51449 / 3B1) TaxID=235279 RepID=Q7VJ03_HELHP|nr:hypothetical protein HH_0448 [Helicobacter hepaticus ATCC 51449]
MTENLKTFLLQMVSYFSIYEIAVLLGIFLFLLCFLHLDCCYEVGDLLQASSFFFLYW